MSRDTIIDDQNRRTQALLESLLSPTVVSEATQEAADAEFATYLRLTTSSVTALSAVDASEGTAATFPAGARLLLSAGAEASRGRAGVAHAARLIRAIAEAVPKGTVLRAYREL